MIGTATALFANGLWMLLNLPAALAFERATKNVELAQQRVLIDLLRRNADSEFGRKHDFAALLASGNPVRSFQKNVPLSVYEDYCGAVNRIGLGESDVLTCEPVRLFEPTSGSSSATKLIPYTATLQREFERAIAPWVARTFLHNPTLMRGAAYWSVSPAIQHADWPDGQTAGGISVGFEDDSAYLGGAAAWLVNQVLAVPADVRRIDNMDTFRYVSLLFLLSRRDLTLVSIWNPTFWTLLVAPLSIWWEALANDLARGTLTPERIGLPPISADLHDHLESRLRVNVKRASEICQICEVSDAFIDDVNCAKIYSYLWPHLRLISCWTDANARRESERLARLFPHASVQPKGLIATEGIVSLPLTDHKEGAALAVRSHFFEFVPLDDEEYKDPMALKQAHELERDGRYGVVLTTGSGLYRYQLGDVVQVVGRYANCPLLRFEGKQAYVSDWYGEKLHEYHVRTVLEVLISQGSLSVEFAMLACETSDSPPAYTLFAQADVNDETLLVLCRELEECLHENFHYAYCRQLGQLGALRLFRITHNAQTSYIDGCVARGQRAGDVKETTLHRGDGWSRQFVGRWV